MTKEDLKNYLAEEAGYDREDVESMDGHQMMDAYLKYEGIIGYTDEIIGLVKAIGINNI